MKCTVCQTQWGSNAIPTICPECLGHVRLTDEQDFLITEEELHEITHQVMSSKKDTREVS
jgi:Zn finger protein HypA/HybF involved in hydrogenase expression